MRFQLGACLFLAASLAASASPTLHIPTACDEGILRTDFEIVVKRHIFRAKREVEIAVALDGLDATVDVSFNKSVTMALGVKRVAFQVHVLDADDRTIETVTIEIPEGTTELDFPLVFPEPGRYALEMKSEDILVAPARARLLPGGHHRLELEVYGSTTALSRSSNAEASAPKIDSVP